MSTCRSGREEEESENDLLESGTMDESLNPFSESEFISENYSESFESEDELSRQGSRNFENKNNSDSEKV